MPTPEVQILVCVNERPEESPRGCCMSRGGLAVLQSLKAQVKARGLGQRVMVVRSGCLKHCSQGTTVAVWPWNHWYAGVKVEDLDELIEAGLAGKPLERLRMPDIPWE